MIKENELKLITKGKDENGYVYILKCNNDTIKIGKTKTPFARFQTIEKANNIMIIDWFISELCSNYGTIERNLHSKLYKYQIKNEWYNYDFKTAINMLNNEDKQQISEEQRKRQNKKVQDMIQYALEMKYKDFEEIYPQYDLTKWNQKQSEVEFALNEMKQAKYNCEYYIPFGSIDILNKNIDIVTNNFYSRESKLIIQKFYMDYIEVVEYEQTCSIYGEDMCIIKNILGIKECSRNIFVEKVMENLK